MSIQTPIKFIKFKFVSVTQASTYGTAPYATVPYTWNAVLSITAQAHQHPTAGNGGNGYYYNGLDVAVGNYIATSGDGKVLKITAVSNATNSSVNVTLQDEDLFNHLMDEVGDGLIKNSSAFEGFIFEVVNGKALVSGSIAIEALPANMPNSALSAIYAKFGKNVNYATVTSDGNLNVTLDWSKIISGKPTTLVGYGITDAQGLNADLTAITGLVGTSGFLKKTAANTWALDTTVIGNQSITISGDATGTGSTSIALTLANSGVTAGTYKSVTVDAKGRVTAGTNPTTLVGYGITDAQGLNADLTAITGLVGTSGFLKKTAANTWELDTTPIGGTSLTALDVSANNSNYYLTMTNVANGGAISHANFATSLVFVPSTGTLSATNYISSSDINLKTDINTSRGLEVIQQLRGVDFTWKLNGMKSHGVIAQEIEEILPELVHEIDGIKKVEYTALIGFLIESIKELDTKIKQLESR